MLLAIYKRSNPKDKWQLVSVSATLIDANKYSQKLKNQAKQNGSNIETAIQSFGSAFEITSTLKEVHSEKMLLN